MSDERRKEPRYQLRQLVHLGFGRETFIPAEGIDISTRGIGCRANRPVDPYSKMFFMLQLDPKGSEPEVTGEGLVMRCTQLDEDHYEIGIEYSEFHTGSLKDIETYLGNAL
ncbi:MAG: hypothetical protein GW949_07450 [Spirochaetales bacterium]|nr:hypothetical protein [Spirochaetales bacterium]